METTAVMMNTLIGPLSLNGYGEADDILFCGSAVVAEWADDILRRDDKATVRYWISSVPATPEAIKQQALVEQVSGAADAEFLSRYSEITGYLWTDEEFTVGGHNMISRLTSEVGNYLVLELEVHKSP